MEFDRHSMSSMNSGKHIFERPGSDIKMTGYLKKLKTMKKKYFVLRCTSSSGPARLEYYDSEKKFRSGQPAKRSIFLHTCFNINKKSDSRHGKHGISLYANEECFTILTDSEREQESWLTMILEYQNEFLPDGDMHKEHYDHVWQVTLQPRGLGQGKGSKGLYRLCLNQTTVSLVKINSSLPQISIQLVTIRTVAHHENSFRLEVGNYAPTGAGEFWFTVDDSSIVKDMHETLLQYMNAIVKDTTIRRDQRSVHLRSNRDLHSQSVTYCPTSSMDAHSPSSPNYPVDYPGGGHRLRSDSRASRNSKISFHEDNSPGFITGYNGDQHDIVPREHGNIVPREHGNIVPSDMVIPSSPSCLDDQMSAYTAMDIDKNKQRSSLSLIASTSTQSSTYFPMSFELQGSSSQRGEMSSSYSDEPIQGYMSMASHHATPASHPIPIHAHSFSEPLHSSHLPTVREGGSNEGYLPMDLSSSPKSSTSIPRPEPAICMLSDSSSGLPPRTYSLGSKPAKKFSSYVEMGGSKKGAGNDMSRATSAPHILKGRKNREQKTESPTPSASPLSMSLRSDDSDSFIDYIPMRPRTASDSFNYRNRTSSFGKTQQACRPRSSSHGQGTRPVISFSKLSVEKARISQEPSQRTSRESSLQGSFDSLRVSNESLRRMSQDMRQTSGSNASDYTEMRGTPSPQMKNMKPEPAGYVNMQVGTSGRRSSPHRVRTDSSGSGRNDFKSNSSDRLHQQTYLQQISDYTEMAPLGHGTVNNEDSYMPMEYNMRHSCSSDSKTFAATPQVLSSHPEDPKYMNVNLDEKKKRSDDSRSLSMENVDTYVIFDPHSENKPRTGSLGSKDKSVSRPVSARKSSSASVSSASSPSSSGIVYPQSSVSSSTCTGGSSDSIKKTSRQSSTEKYGSLGKDFRKKSGSTGSKPSTGKNMFGISLGKDHHGGNSGIPSGRGPSSAKLNRDDEDGEYIEFTPTATKGDNHHHQVQSTVFSHSGASHSSVPHPNRNSSSFSSGSVNCSRSNITPSPAEDDTYTLFSPAVAAAAKSVHFHQQELQHHHIPQTKLGSSPSSSHIKQVPAKEENDYVGFEPGGSTSNFPNMSTHSFRNTRQVEAKEAPVYVGFEPGIKPTPKAPTPLPPQPPSSLGSQIDYVVYDPRTPIEPCKAITPTSATSYILSDASISQIGLDKLKQHYTSSVNNPPESNRNTAIKNQSAPENLDLPGTSLSRSTSQTLHEDEDEYLKYDPANKSSSEQLTDKSVIQDKPSSSSIRPKPQLSQLYINVDEESKPSPLKGTNISSSQREQKKPNLQQQHKLQQPPQNFLRQLSAPASQSSLGMKSLMDSPQIQPHSPQPLTPDILNSSSRHKHLSSSSALDSPSPTESGSRHKHWSGSSSSSQKSRKSSSDSEKSFRMGSKPDSSTNSASSKTKFKSPVDFRSPEGIFGNNSQQSQRNTDGTPSNLSSLEAKIIPVEAKIRQSHGNTPSSGGKVSRESHDHHGLIRPDSTPCIQNLNPIVDPGSRSIGDTPNSTSRSTGIQFYVGPRSRHSLSDLGAYQQMNFASSGLGSLSSDSSNNSGGKGTGGINGMNENTIPEHPSKPLNYVKLDLGCPDGQGDADGKSSRMKTRNSSEADEKQPPLSYAEIDFVRSQCRSKTLPVGTSGDISTSKS